MSILLSDRIETGNVLEVRIDGEWVSALVLLASDEAVILDLCDGSTPVVLQAEELQDYRLFVADPTWI
ncbi:unannotated protein [freshwater metagenome]|uniref:Unannotated protein n=1 Tax=freshwater metagenome TaxID=449393 RepID=A0A6J7TVN5_9ZZZZ|nr:hypothetical protein [Actinomycetota bacterium]MSY11873.1 hypothetical protein [Actinomycetota bacterium]